MQGDARLRLKHGGGGGAGEVMLRRHRQLFAGAAYLGLRSARGDVWWRKMERNMWASLPRDCWARGSGSSFSQRWTPLLETRHWHRRSSSGPPALIILPTAVEQLGEPPSVLFLARQASSRHDVGGGSRRKRQLGFRARKGVTGAPFMLGLSLSCGTGTLPLISIAFILNRWFLAWIRRKGWILVRYGLNQVWVESGHDTAWARSLRLTRLEHGVQAWPRDIGQQPTGGGWPI
jgi:hypothetical protein